MVVGVDRATATSIPKRDIVRLRMEVEPGYFDAHRRDFLTGVAGVLNMPVEDIAILSVRVGCVILVISLPEAKRDGFLRLWESRSPALRELVNDFDVREVRGDDRPHKVELVVSSKFDVDFAWLHLSDLHISDAYANEASRERAELDRFLEDLPRCLSADDVVPDVVLFTGDVSQSGAAGEYGHADDFFSAVKDALPPEAQDAPLFIIPGNHDVAWDLINPDTEITLRRSRTSVEDYDDLLSEPGCAAERAQIQRRQVYFEEFLEHAGKRWGQPDRDSNLHFAHIFDVKNSRLRVGIAGVNSAWLSTRKDLFDGAAGIEAGDFADLDLQRLRLGSYQLRMSKRALKNADVRIALMHHEPLSEWFAEDDRALQREELSWFDFVFRGHQHETRLRTGARVAGQDDFVEVASGALHTQPHWFQGFLAGQIDARRGLMRIIAWTVTGHAKRWSRDPEFGNGGREERALPSRLVERIPRPRTIDLG